MSATLNGLRAVSVRIVTPWRGQWFADVDLDPELVAAAPTSGPAVLAIGSPPTSTLLGVVDPRASGTFVSKARVRVLGGAGGWDQPVPAQHFDTPGLSSPVVYNATAAIVGEKVVDQLPQAFGIDFVRTEGPARRIFADRDWWVDPLTGTTFVGMRAPATPDASLEVLAWDPAEKRAEVSCDALVVPGTVIADPRIGAAPVIVRDVDQTFDAAGSRAILYCADTVVSPLLSALTNMVRELGGTAQLKVYRYRFVGNVAGGLALQAVTRDPATQAGSPAPDLSPIALGTGMSGVTAKLAPGLEVLVVFAQGDSTQPRIVGYSTSTLPLEVTLDATGAAHLAPTAPTVDIGAVAASVAIGPTPLALAKSAPTVTAFAALSTFAAAVSADCVANPGGGVAFVTALKTAADALVAALSGIAATVPTTVVKGT